MQNSGQGWIGSDESGKGDYFGPLVVAAVHVDEASAARLAAAGVRDSKRTSRGQATRLAEMISAEHPHSIVVIGPPRYNELYRKIANLNHLLAWAHARAIEDLLAEQECGRVVVDRFAKDGVLASALMEKGSAVEVQERVRAESDMAVAAASLLARARFLAELEKLSSGCGIGLAAGAGDPVIVSGRSFIKRHGADALGTIAKLHFKTTRKLVGSAS